MEQNFSMNSSFDDLRNRTLENVESDEQQQSDLAYLEFDFPNMNLKDNRHLARHISSHKNNRRSTSMDESGNGFLHFSQGSLSTQKEEIEEDSSPVKDSESLVENRDTAMPGKKMGFVASRHKSLDDLIQVHHM